jgi:hypothetical protein
MFLKNRLTIQNEACVLVERGDHVAHIDLRLCERLAVVERLQRG